MLQTKYMLFAVVAMMAVRSTVAIIGGQDAASGQFPYFVLLETFKTGEPVILFNYITFRCIEKSILG